MNKWRSTLHPFRGSKALILVSVGTLLLSSCVGQNVEGRDTPPPETNTENNNNSPQGSEDHQTAIATSISTASSHRQDLRIDILSLEKHSDEMLVLKMAATNTGEENINFFYSLSTSGGESPTTPNGVTLIDTINQKRHLPFKLTDGKTCHCSDWNGQNNLPPGSTIDIWAAYPSPPEEVESVAISTPITPDFLDIPITNAQSPDRSITDAPVSDAQILKISSFQDDIDGESSRSESGDETTVMLSSDVLFDLNESELTNTAEDSLEELAEEISKSSTTTVRIDGYTDNTGNDSINNPLSEERALAVKNRLENTITRNGIDFEVAGHGSSNPVGDNSTEEGRKKNRRVTITFTE